MVKWYKKISKWFKAEDEYEIKEIIFEDDEQIDINSLREKGVNVTTKEESRFTQKKMEMEKETRKNTVIHGEIDAKISYQYPKGKFRFPVIPDYEPREQRRTRKSPDLNVQPTYSEVRTVTSKRTHFASPPVQEEERKRRPFSPTQIPSPVYGFQKRPVKKEEEPQETKVPIRRSVAETNVDIPAIFRKEDDAATKHQTPETVHNVTAFPFSTQDIVEKGNNRGVDDIKKVDEVKPETGLRIDSETEMGNVTQEVCAKEKYQNRSESMMEVVQNSQSKPSVQEDSLGDEEVSVSLESISDNEAPKIVEFASSDSVSDQESIVPNLHQVTEKLEETIEENSEIELAVREITSQEEVAPTLEAESVKKVESETGEEPIKRKPVPFNVVMLRQDKLRMQNRLQQDEKKTVEIVEQKDEAVQSEMIETVVDEKKVNIDELPYFHFPSIDLLSPPVISKNDDEWLDQQGVMLNETLLNFNVRAKVVNITQGPAVTQFEVQPEPGVKVNKITNLTDDIKLCLAAQDIRMEAPIPGKHTIGIEIPNRKSRAVPLREILESSAFVESESPLTVALGLDITGAPVVTDLRKMPHGLIAGATGSGKSVCINTMLVSLLYKATPQDVKLLLIDPKVVELAPYNNIPHLVSPVITDVKAATAALKWAVEEMDRRYELFAHTGVRDLQRFNKKAEESGEYAKKLPYIVIIIDELADLMMVSPAEVEESICRIAQKARACGIHLVLATQRPSVDVITGLIKANIPTRIAFSVSSQVDSRTIIDTNGADKLLGRGDMLFLENGSSKTVRLQGTFVSDEEIEEVVDFVKKEQEPQYLFMQEDLLSKAQMSDERDELFLEACEFVVYQNAASTSSLQRRFHIGYNRAARLMDMLEGNGIISEARGSKPRDVLMTETEMQDWLRAQNE